jgi:hypothetical protein
MEQPKMKSAIDILKAAEGIHFEDPDGDVSELKLLPPLTDVELGQLESRLPCPLPEDVRQLLVYCRGFEGVLESIDSGDEDLVIFAKSLGEDFIICSEEVNVCRNTSFN